MDLFEGHLEHQGIPLSSSFSSSSSRAALRLTLVLENVFVLALRGRDYKLLQFFGSSVVCGTLNIQLIHRLISPHGRQTDAHRIFHSSSSIWPLPSFCDLDYVGAITNAITIIRTGSFALPTLSLGPLFSIGEQTPVNVTVSSMATWNLCSLNLVHLKF